MKAQILFQNQWGKYYGKTLTVFDFGIWWCGFQLVILNFRLYFRIGRHLDEY